ncbi:peroxiredoxin 4, isoform CRA_c, partial [Mus musculus]
QRDVFSRLLGHGGRGPSCWTGPRRPVAGPESWCCSCRRCCCSCCGPNLCKAWRSDERFRTRENECHFYAGGQVYPGEASRVSVADHSLHLSKAKMFEASGHSQQKTRQTKKIVRKLRPAASGY